MQIFTLALKFNNWSFGTLPVGLVSAIAHSDSLRIKCIEQKSRHESHRLNRVYSRIKPDLEVMTGGQPFTSERSDIRCSIENVFE